MPALTDQLPDKDNFIAEDDPNGNYGALVDLFVWDLLNFLDHPILSVDISSIPSGALVVSAVLSLYCWQLIGAANPLAVYKMTRPTWVEAESTYNIYSAGNNWTAPGGDYVTSGPSGGTATPAAGAWMEVDIQAIVQDAIDNGIDVHLLARYITEDVGGAIDGLAKFRSRNYAVDLTLRPKLTVIYTAGPTVTTDPATGVT